MQNCAFGKVLSISISEIMRISTLLLISSFRGPDLLLIEFMFTWPIIKGFCFFNSCTFESRTAVLMLEM